MYPQDDDEARTFDNAAREAIDLANRLADGDEEADLWDIADGVLAGAVEYWLYARQPCGDPYCEGCESVNTAEKRLKELMRFTQELVQESQYYHTPNDINAGSA